MLVFVIFFSLEVEIVGLRTTHIAKVLAATGGILNLIKQYAILGHLHLQGR